MLANARFSLQANATPSRPRMVTSLATTTTANTMQMKSPSNLASSKSARTRPAPPGCPLIHLILCSSGTSTPVPGSRDTILLDNGCRSRAPLAMFTAKIHSPMRASSLSASGPAASTVLVDLTGALDLLCRQTSWRCQFTRAMTRCVFRSN